MNGNFPSGNLRESDESFFKTSTWKTQKTRLKLIRSISSENLPQLRRTLCRIWRFLDRHFSSPKLRLSITVNHIDSQTWLKVFLLNAEEAKNHSILASDFKRKRGPSTEKGDSESGDNLQSFKLIISTINVFDTDCHGWLHWILHLLS